MAELILIAERVINLDQLVFAHWHPESEGRQARLELVFERAQRTWVPVEHVASRKDRDTIYLNMSFLGQDAEYAWGKLRERSETWQLPSGDKGFWPEIP